MLKFPGPCPADMRSSEFVSEGSLLVEAMRGAKSAVVEIVCLLMLLLPAFPAVADDFQFTPSIAAREDYNSNIFFVEEDREDDLLTTLTGALELSERTERFDMNLRSAWKPFFYRDHSDLNDTDSEYRAEALYQLSPRLDLRGDGSFKIDHRPDRDIETTGLVLGSDERFQYHGGLQGSYLLTEIDTLSLSYTYDQDDWRQDESEREDVEGHTLGANYRRNIDRWLRASQLVLDVGYGHYAYENAEIQSGYALAGIERRLNEIVEFQISAGGRYTDSKNEISRLHLVAPGLAVVKTDTESQQSWGGIGSATLTYAGEVTRCELSVSHDLRTGGSISGPSNLSRVLFSLNHRLLYDLSVGFSTSYFRNTAGSSEYFDTEIDKSAFNIRPRFRWRFFRKLTLEGGYAYTRSEDLLNDTQVERHLAYVQLALGYPLWELIDRAAGTSNSW
jgi:hypothetical protein